MVVKIKRIYNPISKEDGFRVLVDRLWPRGVKKESAGVDLWLKEIAPSTELRKWFGHKADRFHEFELQYRSELLKNNRVDALLQLQKEHPVITLLYAAKDQTVNHAIVLKKLLQKG